MDSVSVDALALHQAAYVFDAHCDTLLDLTANKRNFTGNPPGEEQGHLDLPRLRQGGVDAQVFALFAHPQQSPEQALAQVHAMVKTAHDQILSHPDVRLIENASDFAAAQRSGQLAAILSLEGCRALEADPDALVDLYRMGVRALSLTWNEQNRFASGADVPPSSGGLTGEGRRLLAQCERLGIMVDVSHLNRAAFWDVLAATSKPLIASHSNAFSRRRHRRNLTDRQVKAIAQRGGVIGINFCPEFLHARRATIEHVIDHIETIVQLVGPRHVGLGSDFDGIPATPAPLSDVRALPKLTEKLVQRGYDEHEVMLILGGNFRRCFEEVIGNRDPLSPRHTHTPVDGT